jgi:adenylate cyclase
LRPRYGTKVLISDKTYACQDVQDKFYLRHVDKVVVKGRSKGTDLYEVVGFNGVVGDDLKISDKEKQFCRKYKTGMDLYFMQKFEEAYDVFDEAKNIKAQDDDDTSCLLLMSRCQKFTDDPPGDKWDGCCILTSK